MNNQATKGPTPEDWIILSRHGVTPDNLTVNWSLYLSHTGITELPDNLTVNGWLDLRHTGITPIFEDARGYEMYFSGGRVVAGCRNFTPKEALEHWGSPKYPDRQRGDQFLDALESVGVTA